MRLDRISEISALLIPVPVRPRVVSVLSKLYGLIAAGIAVAIITVVQGLGTKLKATFKSVSDNLGSAP